MNIFLKKTCFSFLIVFLGMTGSHILVASTGGQSPALYLQEISSTRHASQGYTGKSDDIGQMFYNTAYLANEIKGRTLSLGFMKGDQEYSSNIFMIGYGWPTSMGNFTFAQAYSASSNLTAYDSEGKRTGTYTTSESLTGLGHSWNLTKNVSFGESVKLFYLDYSTANATSAVLDLSMVYRPFPILHLGASLQNVTGTEFRFKSQREPLPMILEISPTLDLLKGRARVHYAWRYYVPAYEDIGFLMDHRVGLEFDLYKKYIQARAGYDGNRVMFGMGSQISQYQISLGMIPSPFENRYGATVTFNLDSTGSGPFARPRSVATSDIEEELMEFHEGIAKYNATKYKEAYDKFNSVLRINPDHKLAQQYRERSLLHLKATNYLDEEQQKLIQLHRDLAIRYEKQQNYGEAIFEWRKVLEIEPTNREAPGQIDRIKRSVNAKVQAFHKKGLDTYTLNNRLAAIDAFTEALRFNPEYEPSRNWLVKIKQELSQEELKERERIERLQKAEVFYNRGLSYFGRKTYEESIKEFDQALLLNPEHVNAAKYRQMAIEELEADKQGLRGVEAANALYEKGMKNYNTSQFFNAIKDFNLAQRAFPGHGPSKEMLPKATARLAQQIKPILLEGQTNYRKKKFSDAEINYNDVLKLDPENQEAKNYLQKIQNERQAAITFHFGEGSKAYQKADFSKAIYHLDEVVKLDPGNAQAKAMLADAQNRVKANVDQLHAQALAEFNAEKYDQAIDIWNKVLTVDSSNLLAKRYIKEAEDKKKKSNYGQLVSAYNKKGIELFQNRDFEQAVAYFQKSLEIDPRNKTALDYRNKCVQEMDKEKEQDKISQLFIQGVQEYKKRNYEKAIGKWREVKKIDPQNALVDKYIAQATEAQKMRKLIDFLNGQKYYEQGKWLLAKTSLERAIQENPSNTKARDLLNDTLDRIAEERNQFIQEGDRKMRESAYNDAAQEYLSAYRLDNSAESLNKRDNALQAAKDFELGVKYFNSDTDVGLSIDPFLRVLGINPFDKKANEYINAAKEKGKSRISDWLKDAKTAYDKNDFKRSYDLYNSVLSIEGGNAEAKEGKQATRKKLREVAREPYNEAKEAIALKNWALAVEKLNKVNEILPDYEDSAALLTQAKQELAKKKAAAASSSSSGSSPASAKDQTLINQGIALYRQGKYKEAIGVWNQVPKSSEAYSSAQKYIARAKLKL